MDRSSRRKHRKNGKPAGGSRPGAGRPQGSGNVLGYGEVKAVKAAGLRVPATATQDARDLADEALHVITKVMRGEVFALDAAPRMKAAAYLRTEICGAPDQTVKLAGEDGGAPKVLIEIIRKGG